jgi:predicted regulator of Ras-like GTPase activity (Roadblock/LC7/MglB family)
MAVQGNLKDMSLTSLISINCNEMNQSRLSIKYQGQEATLFFEDGNIVHSALDSQEGDEVIYTLLTWEEGVFELEQGVPPPRHTVTASWSGLLLEGMRRMDEEMAGLESNQDEAEPDGPRKMKVDAAERLVGDLRKIAGVKGSLVCSGEGQVLIRNGWVLSGQDTGSDPLKEASLTAFVGQRAVDLGVLLNAGPLKQAVLTGAERKVMIVTHEQCYVGLSLWLRTAEAVERMIKKTLRRYQ